MTISREAIAEAKKRTKYGLDTQVHEHDDCIRIAYQWLDAQVKIKAPCRSGRPFKHIIERWGGRYVSRSDVEVAAELHPDIKGEYPRFNISGRLIRPSARRLENIPEAKTHANYAEGPHSQTYSYDEGTPG
jgi:hypothetical protein